MASDPFNINERLKRRAGPRDGHLLPGEELPRPAPPPSVTPQREAQVRNVVADPVGAAREAVTRFAGGELSTDKAQRIKSDYTRTQPVDTGPTSPLGAAVPNTPGVYAGRAKIGGVEQNVYSDSAFDPLMAGATNRGERDALARRSPVARAQFAEYDVDRSRGAAALAQRQEAASNDAAMWRAAEINKDVIAPWDAAAKLNEAGAKADNNRALAQRREVEAASMDATAQREGAAAANTFVKQQATALAQRFQANPDEARALWGADVSPEQATSFELLKTLVEAGENPQNSEEGRIAVSQLSSYLTNLNNASGTGTGYVDGTADLGAFNVDPLSRLEAPENLVFGDGTAFAIEGPPQEDGERRRTAVKPTGERFQRESLAQMLARLRQIDERDN